MNTETANYHQSNEVSSIKVALLCVIFFCLFARPAVEITSNNRQAQSDANYVPPTRLFVLINHVFILKQTSVKCVIYFCLLTSCRTKTKLRVVFPV